MARRRDDEQEGNESIVAEATERLADLVRRLASEPAAARLPAEDWVEDQEFNPGEVVEIDSAIKDWFAEYLVTVRGEADWFLADDGAGWFYLLWIRDNKCYVRLLTDDELQEVERVAGLKPEIDPELAGTSASEVDAEPNEEPAASQRSLW